MDSEELTQFMKMEREFLVNNIISASKLSTKKRIETRKRILPKIKKAVGDKDWNRCYATVLYYRAFEPAYIPCVTSKKSRYQVLLGDMRPAYYIQYGTDFVYEYISCLNELYEIGFLAEGGAFIVYNADGKEEALGVAEKASSIMKKYLYPPASVFFKGNPAESIYVYRNINGEDMWRKVKGSEILNLEQLRRQPEELE